MQVFNVTNSDNLVIRSAQRGDSEAIWLLLTQFATSYVPDRACCRAQFDSLLIAPYAQFLVAEHDNEVKGYALAFHLPTLYANGLICEIHELMVDPAHRNRGIGHGLVRAIIGNATQAGIREVTVPTRRAGDYYLKFGFEATATYFKMRLPSPDYTTAE